MNECTTDFSQSMDVAEREHTGSFSNSPAQLGTGSKSGNIAPGCTLMRNTPHPHLNHLHSPLAHHTPC